MIREGKPLPPDVLDHLPTIIETVQADPDIIALFSFGSLPSRSMGPLSDLDFAVLLSFSLNRQQRFNKHVNLICTFVDTFHTEEIDLIILNDSPPRYGHNILATGKLLFCRDPMTLIEYIEVTQKHYLDFKPYKEHFDREFLQGIGYSG